MRTHPLTLSAFALLLPALALAQPNLCDDGFAGEFPCQSVDLLARLPLNATPDINQSSSDIWGWTDPSTGIEYAIINQYDHTAFVDLSDPTAPVVIGTITAPSQSIARDAKVYANHAFLTTDNGGAGVQVFDLTRLRNATNPPTSFEADAYFTGLSGPHNFAIDESSGFGYFVGTSTSGIQVLDLQDQLNPVSAGNYVELGSVHDLQCLTYDGPDADYSGREVCFASMPSLGALAILDVTDKQNPVLIAEAPYPDAAYTHQGWLTDDGRHFLLNDEFDEFSFDHSTRTIIFNVADLDEPAFDFEHLAPTTSTDHNLFVRGDYVFQANYTAGLRILDLAAIDAGTLTEVAFFDTHPESDSTGFDGAFGVYPFFESGIVVVSDMSRGLFVLQPRLGDATDTEDPVPAADFALSAYPNPSDGHATIVLSVSAAQHIRVAVYDVLGREVTVLHDGPLGAGEEHEVRFDGSGLPAGPYVVRATGATFEATRSVTLVR